MADYKQKVQNIINGWEKENYATWEGDRDDALEWLETAVNSFPNYVNTVSRMEISMPIWRARYDGQEFRDHVQSADENRHWAHERAISSVNQLNRESKRLGLEPFMDIDTSDRYAVADAAGKFVNETFYSGQPGGMDSAVKTQVQSRQEQTTRGRMQELYGKFGSVLEASEAQSAGLEK